MNFHVDLNFHTLRCVQPDEDEEEPYLWTFFFKLDGSTVRQVQPGILQLAGSVKVTAGPGGHGNLSKKALHSGETSGIPANVGSYQAELTPIRLQVLGQPVAIPGRVVAFLVLMEEDATSDGSIVKAHAALRDFIEVHWNDFITNGLNQSAVMSEVSTVQQNNPALTGRSLILTAVQNLIDRFVDSLESPAADLVRDAVIDDSNVFDLIVNWFDADDSMGTSKAIFDEQQIIDAGLSIPIHNTIIRTEDNRWTAYHEYYGGLSAHLAATASDYETQTSESAPVPLRSGEYVFPQDYVCIQQGAVAQWTVSGVTQEEDIRFTYPFLNVRWSIAGNAIADSAGTVEFVTHCRFPEFDPSQPPRLVVNRSENRRVRVRYQVEDLEDLGKRLKLWNDPEDGNYDFIVTAVGSSGNMAEIPLLTEMVTFYGQSIVIGPEAFWNAFQECIDRIASYGDRYAKSKRVGPKDLWAARSRFRIYEDLVQTVDQVAAVRGVDDVRIAALKQALANKLRIRTRG
jgi:hypothetical protein